MTPSEPEDRPRTAFSAGEAGERRPTGRTSLGQPTASEACLTQGQGGVEIRTATLDPRLTERLAQIARHSPGRLALFQSVYQGRPSKARALKAKCLDCSCWQTERIRDCSSVTCPLWRVRPFQKARSRRISTPDAWISRTSNPTSVRTAEAA